MSEQIRRRVAELEVEKAEAQVAEALARHRRNLATEEQMRREWEEAAKESAQSDVDLAVAESWREGARSRLEQIDQGEPEGEAEEEVGDEHE